jgi:prepilin-type N-terminal cleavage/methylation domain-containing protein
MSHRAEAARGGFTLIEVLVTLCIFSLALGVLVAALRSGAGAWRQVRTHQRAQAEEARALDLLREDCRALFVHSDEFRPVAEVEVPGPRGGHALHLTTINPATNLRVGRGAVWHEVTYTIAEDAASGEPVLQRTEVRHVTRQPVSEPVVQQLVLRDVEELEVDFVGGGEVVPEWNETDTLPAIVHLALKRNRHPDLRLSVPVPAGVAHAQ